MNMADIRAHRMTRGPGYRRPRLGWVAYGLLALLTGLPGWAQAATITDISYASLPGNQIEARVTLDVPPAGEPLHFTIDNPARIALDFPETSLAIEQRNIRIGVGKAESINAVEAGGRTRLVMNLSAMVPYSVSVAGNAVIVRLDSVTADITSTVREVDSSVAALATPASIEDIDFRRGPDGEGRVSVRLSNPGVGINIEEKAGEIIVDFAETTLPAALDRRLDVVDFATPAREIDTYPFGNGTRMVVTPTGIYEQVAYQSGNVFTVELKPLTAAEQEAVEKEKFGYTGERLSLNFQDIEVRAVLQLIADFTGLNLVAADSVNGSVTLRLKNVPWDQALDIILKSKGLGMRQAGNVLMVAPQEEIAQREKLELEANEQLRQLAPLMTEFLQIDYARAEDIAALIKSDARNLLTERGNISVDQRTNTLLVQETADVISQIRKLVQRLDVPVRQVLIDSRIVIANSNFSRDLGVDLNYQLDKQQSGPSQTGDTTNPVPVVTNPGVSSGTFQRRVPDLFTPGSPDQPSVGYNTLGTDGYIKDLAMVSAGGAGTLGFAVGKLGSWLLDLEITALQAEGRGEVISQPQVITANQQTARIAQGVEIPFQQAASSGATNVQFKAAVLSLEVTPQITPDDRVIMDLLVNNDSVGEVFAGVPSINTNAVQTRVLVDNGETVVLGGVFVTSESDTVARVPLLGDLPYVGALFRDTSTASDKSELLIFVTPKILKDSLTGGL